MKMASQELYAAQLTIQPVRGFEYSVHYFSAIKSALPAIDEPLADVPSSSPRYISLVPSLHSQLFFACCKKNVFFLQPAKKKREAETGNEATLYTTPMLLHT